MRTNVKAHAELVADLVWNGFDFTYDNDSIFVKVGRWLVTPRREGGYLVCTTNEDDQLTEDIELACWGDLLDILRD